MSEPWIIVISAAVTGTLTLIATAIPKIADAIRERNAKRESEAANRAIAIANLRKLYLAAFSLLDEPDDPTWVSVAAAAADCIPYTSPGTSPRDVLVTLIKRERVDIDAFIDALPAQSID